MLIAVACGHSSIAACSEPIASTARHAAGAQSQRRCNAQVCAGRPTARQRRAGLHTQRGPGLVVGRVKLVVHQARRGGKGGRVG
jgi:hypothetical protein